MLDQVEFQYWHEAFIDRGLTAIGARLYVNVGTTGYRRIKPVSIATDLPKRLLIADAAPCRWPFTCNRHIVEQDDEPDDQFKGRAHNPFADSGIIDRIAVHRRLEGAAHLQSTLAAPRQTSQRSDDGCGRLAGVGGSSLSMAYRVGSSVCCAYQASFCRAILGKPAFGFLLLGVAWTDPDLLKPDQSLGKFPLHIKGHIVIFFVLALCAWLVQRGAPNDRLQ